MGYGGAMARGAWGGIKRVPGLFGRFDPKGKFIANKLTFGIAGAALGGMVAGPAGVVPGMVLGAAGAKAIMRSGGSALGKAAGFAFRRPRMAGGLIGAALAIPTIANLTHDLFSPTVKPPNFAFAHPNAQYGMDPDNLNTQGLTLALLYRR